MTEKRPSLHPSASYYAGISTLPCLSFKPTFPFSSKTDSSSACAASERKNTSRQQYKKRLTILIADKVKRSCAHWRYPSANCCVGHRREAHALLQWRVEVQRVVGQQCGVRDPDEVA